MNQRFAHLAAVVGGVVATAARDAGRPRLVIVDWCAPESALLERCLAAADVSLPITRASDGGAADIETLRARARSLAAADGLLVDPVNKTVAVLFPELLAEPLLPLADLYATQVRALAGDWSAPDEARALFERAGGIDAVDAFLTRHLEERRPLEEALGALPDDAARRLVRERFEAGWWWRRRAGVVPKLGGRTLGIDLR